MLKNGSSKSPQLIIIQFTLRGLGNPCEQRDDSPIDDHSGDCRLLSGAKPSDHTVYGPLSSGRKPPRGSDRDRGRLDGGRRRPRLPRVGGVPAAGLSLGLLVGVRLREGA